MNASNAPHCSTTDPDDDPGQEQEVEIPTNAGQEDVQMEVGEVQALSFAC